MRKIIGVMAVVLMGLGVALPAGAEVIAIMHAKAYTAGPEGTVENATILVEDGRIKAIGAGLAAPAGANIIDAKGKPVTPGFMNSYTSLTLGEISYSAGPTDEMAKGGATGPAFDVRYGINPASVLIPVNRARGLTHAMVAPQAVGSVFAGTGAIIDLGQGPDITLKTGVAVFVQLDEDGNAMAGGARSASWLSFREALEDARNFDSHRKAYDEGRTRNYSLSRANLEALVPVVKGLIPVVVTVSRASDIHQAIMMAREFGLKLVIARGEQAWMVADELAAAKVPVIIAPTADLPEHFEDLGATLKNAARLQAAGVQVALTSAEESGAHDAYAVSQAAGIAVAHGLPWAEALKALTITPARIWGIDRDYGSLEVGKKADFVIWSGDPFELTSFVDAELIEGRIMPLETRRTKLRDRYLQLDKMDPPFVYR
jgi:imidazolonepropionase-like amidohydrolase